MKAIITFMDSQLMGSGKMIESTTKKDIKVTAKNLAVQMDVRLMDIIYEDSPYPPSKVM